MVQLGYDRDFDQLREQGDTVQFPWTDPGPALDSWQEIGVDHTGAIRVPDGTALDLGSVGKAWASDMIAAGIEQEPDSPRSSVSAATSGSPAPTGTRGTSRSPRGRAPQPTRWSAWSAEAWPPPARRSAAGSAAEPSATTCWTPAPAHRPPRSGAR